METLLNFIPEDLLILIAGVYVLGIFLKKLESVKDKYITSVLMLFSIVLSMVLSKPSAISLLQGILCWGVAVGVNQTYKQLSKRE